MVKIHMKKYQFLINKVKVLALSILTIQNLLLNTQMIWVIFIKAFKNTSQTKNA